LQSRGLELKSHPPQSRNGFTLVEMLVALFVFGLISAAGVTILRTSADAQLLLREKLGERATLSRLSNLIEADLAQAVPRPVRSTAGETRPAFETGDGSLFAFSRIGMAAEGDTAQPSLARIGYRLEAGKLIRSAAAHADGAPDAADAVLVEGVKDGHIRVRQPDGGWRDDWTAVDAEQMPRALELSLTAADGRNYRMLFLVGAVSVPPASPDAEDAGG
jgi:general secretion pathway protein J